MRVSPIRRRRSVDRSLVESVTHLDQIWTSGVILAPAAGSFEARQFRFPIWELMSSPASRSRAGFKRGIGRATAKAIDPNTSIAYRILISDEIRGRGA
jgi:hypothetical protein